MQPDYCGARQRNSPARTSGSTGKANENDEGPERGLFCASVHKRGKSERQYAIDFSIVGNVLAIPGLAWGAL